MKTSPKFDIHLYMKGGYASGPSILVYNTCCDLYTCMTIIQNVVSYNKINILNNSSKMGCKKVFLNEA